MRRDHLFDEVLRFRSRPDPYPLFASLREEPACRQHDGTWVVSTFAEVSALLTDPRLGNDVRAGSGGQVADEGNTAFVTLDPPEHTRLRGLTWKHFGPPACPGRVEGLRSRVAALVEDHLARLDPAGFDMVADLAYPIPVQVICDLLGVPAEDEDKFGEWSQAIALQPEFAPDFDEPRYHEARERAFMDSGQYFMELIARHRREGGDTLLARMANDPAPDRMSDLELATTANVLLIGGHETTVNLVTQAWLLLLRNPDQLARLQADPSLVTSAVEEALRLEPPLQFRPRVAYDDIEVGGATIPRGATVILLLAAANRDPARFPDPDRFDVGRADNPHLSFAGGTHFCFGAPLGRLEAQIILGETVRRLDAPRLLSDPILYRPMADLRGPRELRMSARAVRPARPPEDTSC